MPLTTISGMAEVNHAAAARPTFPRAMSTPRQGTSVAGVSKESGVPTFRDAMDGLWAKFNPHELATPMAFKANPKLVWDWYQYRRDLVKNAKPNPGHYALAALEKHFKTFTVITQNVDDLHEQAGSTEIVHLHGNIART